MATKKTTTKKKGGTKKKTAAKKSTTSTPSSSAQTPMGAGVAIAISAAFIGLIAGGVFAHQYVSKQSLNEDEIKEVLADEINKRVDEGVQEELTRREAAEKKAEEEAALAAAKEGRIEVDPEDPETHSLYINDYYGVRFSFPNDWSLTPLSGAMDMRESFAELAKKSEDSPGIVGGPGDLFMWFSVEQIPDTTFEAYVNERLSTEESIQLNMAVSSRELEATIDDVTFDNESLLISGAEAVVNWEKWTKPTYYEGPAQTNRTYWIDGGDKVYEVRMYAPTFDEVDALIQEGRNVMATWQFIGE